MSTSIVTVSGMTLVFTPPWTTLGEKVVWVQACSSLAVGTGQAGERVGHLRRVQQTGLDVGRVGRWPSTRAAHISSSRAFG